MVCGGKKPCQCTFLSIFGFGRGQSAENIFLFFGDTGDTKIAAKTSTRVKGLTTFLTPLGLEPNLLFDMAGGFKDHRAFHTSGGTGTLG